MALMYEANADVAPVIQALSNYTEAWTGQKFTNPSSSIAFQGAFNPGHTGTSVSLEYDLKYSINVGATGATYVVTWQYKDATGSSWETLCVHSSAAIQTQNGLNHVGVSTAQMTMPIQVRAMLTATAAAQIWLFRTSAAYANRFAFRSVGLID